MEARTLSDIVRSRLKELKLGPVEAAKAVGLEPTFIRDIVRDRKRSVSAENFGTLARALRFKPEQLAHRLGHDEAGTMLASGDVRPADVSPRSGFGARDVAIRGTAATHEAGVFRLAGEVDLVRRPPGLLGARDVYAIFVVGDSMAPEHKHGELRFVAKHRPYAIGDTVLVQMRPTAEGETPAHLGHYGGEKAGKMRLHKLQPPGSKKVLDRSDILDTYKVLTMNELFEV